ncbi:MAG TPA: hypothetical protein VHV51_03510 [Polyangiaceae bacterium]|jgi:hypothetical protein|nr:hypothetical protein [Polyangiaceae bacterium]
MISLAKPVTLALLALAASACSSKGASASGGDVCAEVTACGGDLSGSWQIDSECLSIASPFDQPECQSSIADVSVGIQGSVSYDGASAGTQTSSLSYQFAATERYSAACLEALDFDGATPEACHGLELLWAGPISVSCAPASDACECDFADQESSNDAQSFTVVNDQILPSDGSEPIDFCRTGDRLVETASTDSSRAVLTLHLMP